MKSTMNQVKNDHILVIQGINPRVSNTSQMDQVMVPMKLVMVHFSLVTVHLNHNEIAGWISRGGNRCCSI